LQVERQIVLKGTPASITDIRAGTDYSNPSRGHLPGFAEAVWLAPGETVLIVGEAGEPVFVGFCSPSRHWDAETARTVRSVFPSLP